MHVRAAWPTIALLLPLLAGCLGDGPGGQDDAGVATPSPKRFGILPPEEVWVASTVDGKRLHNAVFRPDTQEPVPVWINFSPYWADTAMAGGDHFAQYMVAEYVPRGYAVVLSAVRGTGHSEGCFQFAGDLEVQDAYDVVDHFANAAWSNGRVGAGGKSYDSTTQNGLVAKDPHPALKAVFHVSGITDFYRYNLRGGVPYENGLTFNPRYWVTQGFDEQTAGGEEGPESLLRAADDAACPEGARIVASGTLSAAAGQKDAFWQERDWARFAPDSTWEGGLFFVHGLQDWNVKPDHVLPWLDSLPPGADVTAWLHQWTREPEGGHVYPMRDDWNATMLRWMDHWLKDQGPGLADRPRFEVQGDDGLWRQSLVWPAAEDAAAATFDLAGNLAPGADGLPRATVVEAQEGLRVLGAPRLTVRYTPLHPDAVLTAVLYDVAPDGTRRWVNDAVLRALYADGLETPVPVVPGVPREAVLEFWPQDTVLAPGHALGLALGAEPDGRTGMVLAPGVREAVQYDTGAGSLTYWHAPADAMLAVQPAQVDCFAC